MNQEKHIDEILDRLVKYGSEISYLEDLRSKTLNLVKKDESLEDMLNGIAEDIKIETDKFLDAKSGNGMNFISGIQSCIYLPSANGDYKLKLIGGSRDRNIDLPVDENTLFDVASITKLYTLLLVFKLEQKGIINLNDEIASINPNFPNLGDFTWKDLIRMHGDLVTDGRIDEAKSYEEAYEVFTSMYLKNDSRKTNKYTDLGAMVIGDTIELIISREKGYEVSFAEIMDEYLLKPLGNNLGLVNDPKARILGGALGHAGIFTTSDDLAKLAKSIYEVKFIRKSKKEQLGTVTFPGRKITTYSSNKGKLGLYVKHPAGWDKTFTAPEFSKGSFSHQGYTGAVAAFDPNNKIHHNILVNSVYENEEHKQVKPVGMVDAFTVYQSAVTKNIMTMYVVKEYYNRFCNVKENIDETKFIK